MGNKAIKYRIYPTEEQKIMFNKTFGCCRKVYNFMLADKINSYKDTGKFVSVTPAKYKTDFPYLKEVDSLALANCQLNLQTAFKNCFGKNRKKKNGFPKFKSKKHSRKSYTTNNQKGTVEIYDNYIKIPKVKFVKAVIHRKPESDWKIKSITISRDSDNKYYASVLFEFDKPEVKTVINIDNAIGLDYSSSKLYVDSNGNDFSNHKYYRDNSKKLAKYQRCLSRKIGSKKNERKSNNYYKQLNKVNKLHRHIVNQRKDALHKRSTEIANQYDIVCIEDLNLRAMSNKAFGNGKSTLDNAYGMFCNMLSYKLQDRGKHLIIINKWFPSSQLCHCCGYRNPDVKIVKKDKSKKYDYIKSWICPSCGEKHDRDINAAINILNEGLRIYIESQKLIA